MKTMRIVGSAIFALCVGVVHAQAAAIGYTLTLSGPVNNFRVQLDNDASLASITGFSMTIGLESKHFDVAAAAALHGMGSFTLVSPDTVNFGLRSDVVAYTFTGFDPGDVFQFLVDPDDDITLNSDENYTMILFNNGLSANSLITVTFSDGISLAGMLPDFEGNEPFIFRQSQLLGTPEPSTFALLAVGSICLLGCGWRARQIAYSP